MPPEFLFNSRNGGASDTRALATTFHYSPLHMAVRRSCVQLITSLFLCWQKKPSTQSFKMPSLDASELNIVFGVLGGFIILYGFISIKIKSHWYLGEARMSHPRRNYTDEQSRPWP